MAFSLLEFPCLEEGPENEGKESLTGQQLPMGHGSCQLLSPTSTRPPMTSLFSGQNCSPPQWDRCVWICYGEGDVQCTGLWGLPGLSQT